MPEQGGCAIVDHGTRTPKISFVDDGPDSVCIDVLSRKEHGGEPAIAGAASASAGGLD